MAAFLALIIELVQVDQRVTPAIETKVPGGIVILAGLFASVLTWWKLRGRPSREGSAIPYLLLSAQVEEAAKRPLTEAIEAVPAAASDGLEVILGDWVRWTFEVNSDTPTGVANNRSCWASHVEGGRRLLVFSTGGAFTDEAIKFLEDAAALVDLLLTHNTA